MKRQNQNEPAECTTKENTNKNLSITRAVKKSKKVPKIKDTDQN